MRLRSFRVRAFRCIRDSGDVAIRDLAVLIGKNEGGKTAILEALAHLNKDNPFRPVDLCDEMYEDLPKGIRIVEGNFDLTGAEVAGIKEKFPDCPDFKVVRILRQNTPDKISYEYPEIQEFPVRYELAAKALPDFTAAIQKMRETLKALTTVTESDPSASELLEGANNIEEPSLVTRTAFQEKISGLKSILEASPFKPEIAALFAKVEQAADKLFQQVSLKDDVTSHIAEKLHPRFVYFSEYKQIFGQINLAAYLGEAPSAALEAKKVDAEETVENLFFLAGLDAKQLEKIKAIPDERVKYLSECGAKLTKALEPTWITQKIEVEFEFAENILIVKISDLHSNGMRSNKGLLKRRSEGFRWHFSFFVNFTAESQRAELREAILLLDEPGLHLHPAQQVGLLDILKQLAGKNQVLYTTHSPFMILDYDVGSLLTVELDQASHLSSIQPAYWKGDPATALLVLHALGGQTISDAWTKSLAQVVPPVVVVEGPTDYMYLKVMLELVRRRIGKNRVEFPFDWEIVPAHGSSAIAPLAMFHVERGFKSAVLYDNEPQARKYAEGLISEGFIQNHVVFAEMPGKTESDIEDFFSDTEYLEATNSTYGEILKDARYVPIDKKRLKELREGNKGTTRIVPLLEGFWRTNRGWGDFSKTVVCERLCELAISRSDFLSEKTVEKLKALFDRINSISALPATPDTPVPAEVSEPVEPKATPKKQKS